jgi:hypothetical protein
MDPTIYYQKVRAQEAAIKDEFPILTSLATPEGGKEGLQIEARRLVAARMIVNGKARLATEKERQAFRAAQVDAKRVADEREAMSRLQISVVSTADLERLKNPSKKQDKSE